MTRRHLLAQVPGAPAILAQHRPRNLVFILSDDHRYDMISGAGHPWLKTPHMDRLARGGALFSNAFATISLCSPSRACILTGQYAHSHGVIDNVTPLPDSLPTFPKVLQQAGYRTGFFGKWHMGGASDLPRPGFDRWASFRGQGTYRDPVINFDGSRRKVPGYVSDILTDEAETFIAENAARPFLLYLAHKAVHDDFIPAARHKDLYTSESVPLPASMADTEENYRGRPDWVRRIRGSIIGVDGMYNHRTTFEPFYRDYCRTIMGIDDSIGRIMDALAARRLLEDTLIIYMSDNGFLLGEHGLIDKRNMYEPSIRIPLIAHCPSLFGGGRRMSEMALNIDIAPTLLEAAGATIPGTVHGRSLLPLLAGRPPGGWRQDFLYEYFWERDLPQTPSIMGLRTNRFSYAQYHGAFDLDELYDVQKDPHQMRNLLAGARVTSQGGGVTARIQDPELRKMVLGLQARMRNILEQTNGRAEPHWRA